MSVYPSAPPVYQEYPSRSPHEFPAMPAMQMPMPMPQPNPPPSMYYPAVPAITVQPTAFGPGSVSMTCPHCNCLISTETSRSFSTCTHCCCLLLFFTSMFTLCSCLPYFVCDPETVEHSCPNCHARLGAWHS